jgi:Flp pilus assembly protein TadB
VTRRLRRAAAALLVVCAGLFIIGVTEEDDTHAESSETAETHDEGAESAQSEVGHDESEEEEEEEDERILGVDVESPGAVALAVTVSLALAIGLWLRTERWLSVAAVGVAAAFAVLDVVEVGHQVDESQTGLAVLAGVIGAGHLAAAMAAGLSIRRGT